MAPIQKEGSHRFFGTILEAIFRAMKASNARYTNDRQYTKVRFCRQCPPLGIGVGGIVWRTFLLVKIAALRCI